MIPQIKSASASFIVIGPAGLQGPMRAFIQSMIRRYPRLSTYGAAVVVVVIANLIALPLDHWLGYARVSMIFLAAVLISAVKLGSGPAYLASILGFFSYNFYLVEPQFTLGFESEDYLILLVFLAVAMLTGGLAGRVRDEASRSLNRARTTGVLFQAGRDFAALGDESPIAERLVEGLAEAAQGEAVLLIDGRVRTRQGAMTYDPALIEALEACQTAGVLTQGPDGWRLRALWAEGRRLGAAAWKPSSAMTDEADQTRLIHVLIDMGTTAIARSRLSQAWAEIEARERTESLRNALLSSISHDLRTPLSAILASASSLKTFRGVFEPQVQDDLLDTITEEAERLNAFVGNLLSMTRLEATALSPQSGPFDISEALDRTLRRYERRKGARRLSMLPTTHPLIALGDPILFEQVLGNVLDNALRFSPEDGVVTILAKNEGPVLAIEVADQGAGVPKNELELIFDKFYRSSTTRETLQGAGLGLSIVKGFMEAMGGAATARLGEQGRGLIVRVELPRGDA